MNTVEMAHGSGGLAMQQLINRLFMDAFDNPWLAEQEDQARIDLSTLTAQGDRLAFSTDSYVIDPLFFPGGDIGKLAVCGTANDVAVSGAVPRFLSCGFILEEGLPMETLSAVVSSMAHTAREAGIAIVTGDTKVVERGGADGVYINTAGVGGGHGMEHPVSGMYNVVHGKGLAALTPPLFRHSYNTKPERYAAISRLLGGGTQMMLGDLIEQQFLGGAYNPQLGAAIALVMIILIFICMWIMNKFDDGSSEEGGLLL